jgi:hypothetical protein
MLSVLASGIWLVYLRLIFRNILSNGFNSIRVSTGIILLPTVSTQSIALLMNSFFIGQVTPYVNQSLIILGYLFYVIGFIVIIKYYFTIKLKRLLLSWSNTNSILHGALSISGLASLESGCINDNLIILTWFLATSLFLLVEGISLIKLYYRIRFAGIMRGAFLYDVSQWSRNFTYGMYYAFTLSISEHYLLINFIIHNVSQYGQYLVLFMLLIEIIIYLRDKLSVT